MGSQYSLQTTPLVLIINVLENFYQPSDSLGGRYCMWWFFDTEFVHSIYFRDFIFLSVNFTHPVPKFMYPKFYKNSKTSCPFSCSCNQPVPSRSVASALKSQEKRNTMLTKHNHICMAIQFTPNRVRIGESV